MKLPRSLIILLKGLSGLALIAVGSLFLFGGSSSGSPFYALAGVICYAFGLIILVDLLRHQISQKTNDVKSLGHKVKKISRRQF